VLLTGEYKFRETAGSIQGAGKKSSESMCLQANIDQWRVQQWPEGITIDWIEDIAEGFLDLEIKIYKKNIFLIQVAFSQFCTLQNG